jgi:hypothetical protein
MPSVSFQEWVTTRAIALNEIEQALVAVAGTARGRRYATQQLNQAYALMLASQFQGYCRGLHTECADHLVTAIVPPPHLRLLVQSEFTRGRQLDRGNARPGSLGTDFGRFGIDFWAEVENHDFRNQARRAILEDLNNRRNAIAHQDFDPTRLGGTILRLNRVRQWRAHCEQLAQSFDEVMRNHLQGLTGASPW